MDLKKKTKIKKCIEYTWFVFGALAATTLVVLQILVLPIIVLLCEISIVIACILVIPWYIIIMEIEFDGGNYGR